MKLWKENRLDQEWELSDDEAVARFVAFEDGREGPFLNFEREVATFIGSRDGLNSVMDVEDQRRLEDVLWKSGAARAARNSALEKLPA